MGVPVQKAPSPRAAPHRRPSDGAETTPASFSRAMSVAKTGMPRRKFFVASIGSTIHRRPPGLPWLPNSSPTIASSGRSRSRRALTIRSTASSTSVTGVRSAFVRTENDVRKERIVIASASSASESARLRSELMKRILLSLLPLVAPVAHAAIDPAAAQSAFSELRVMCDRDAGRLWGVGLCGPTLFVERGTRAVVGNDPLPSPILPKNIGIANTAVDWNGKHWTMAVWPLPEDSYARRVILAHESFHRVQERLGFPPTGPSNAHLDTSDGRTLLQLEGRALAAARQAGEGEPPSPVSSAPYFPRVRRHKFP